MDSVRKVLTFMGIAGLGLVAGFITLSLLMPPSAPRRAVVAPPPPPPAVVAAIASPSPSAASAPSTAPSQAPPPASPTGDALHDPDRWSTAQREPSDTDVEFDDIGTPAPGKKPARPPQKAPSHKAPGAPQKAPSAPDEGGMPAVDTSRARDLARWKPAITAYSKRHYGEAEWALQPTCIVLHFTAGRLFPWNLVKTDSFEGEAPGLASHYVIDGDHIWQLIPPDVRSRGAYGINHRAINIEMIAVDGPDLARRPATLRSCVALCRWLMSTYGIPRSKVYSHTAVSHMNKSEVPEVLDLVDPRPYGKPDPGEQNMRTVRSQL